MLQQAVDFISYFFSNPSFLGISLALVFCVIWLIFYKPPFLQYKWLWAVIIGGAIAAPIGIFLQEFVITPWLVGVAPKIGSLETLNNWVLVVAVPVLFIQGLVREGAKFFSIVACWLYLKRKMSLKFGLVIGAIAGAGFGILEAQWTLNYIINAGWAWEDVEKYGAILALAGFWETFFVTGYNIATGALLGWGLGRGWGWQFYLLVAASYTILMYGTTLAAENIIEGFQVELIVAAWSLLLTGVVLWLRGKEESGKSESYTG